MTTSGSCVCGKVQYRLNKKLTDCSYCHCSICRKLTGSAFAAYGAMQKTSFEWVKGKDKLSMFSQTRDTDRWFCSDCGSFLITEHKPEPNTLYISLGTLDSSPEIKMEYHQFFNSKVKWCETSDKLEKYEEWPDDF